MGEDRLSLTGNLEDLPLLDIIQIVSFSNKTGYLSIAMEGGQGGIVFREGLVVAAFTADSPPADPRLATLPAEKRAQVQRSRIVFALEQLARLREGAFGFELTSEVPSTLGARDLRLEAMPVGINPQDLLLDLAAGMDEGQAASAAAVEASFAAPEEGALGQDPSDTSPIVPSNALATDLDTPLLDSDARVETSPDLPVGAWSESPADTSPGASRDLPADTSPEVAPAPLPESPAGTSPDASPVLPADTSPEVAPAALPESAADTSPDASPDLPADTSPEVAPAALPESPSDTSPGTPLESLADPSPEVAPVALPESPSDTSPGLSTGTLPELSGAPTPEAAARPPVASAPKPRSGPTSEQAGARTLLLVDDEPDVRQLLADHFGSAGYRIEEAGDPETAAKAAGRLRSAATPFVLVTDLGMPSSGGASFHGGFEVVKRLWKMNLRPPVLMMTESLGQSLRLRARQMGIQAFVFKPTLSKLNSRQFEADIAAFAGKLASDVLPKLAEIASLKPVPRRRKDHPTRTHEPEAGPPVADAAQPFDFLRRRLRDLRQPGDSNEIAVLVMKVAREFFERSILFVVKNEQARGLGGFGLAPREETLNLLARQVAIPLTDPSIFREVVVGRRVYSGPPPDDRWTGHLMGRIGRFQSRDVALLPLLAHRETIALLFGDNPESGRAVSGLDALEVFVHQAGIALENVFLQRRLQALQEGEEKGPVPG
jgi:CheY-like chemotaxis protein